MDYTIAATLCGAIMLVLLLIGVPIAYSLFVSSITIGLVTFGPSVIQKLGWSTFQFLFNLNWTPLPLFMLLACIMAQTRIGEDLYKAARNWLSFVPGGLIAASLAGQAVMAAALGASGATILAVGKIAEPEFERYGYNKPFAVGGLLCGGVLGPLIPPSASMIFYAVVGNVPLGPLFIAGIVPGLLLSLMLITVTVLLCAKNPTLGPAAGVVAWSERIDSLKRVWPVAVVFIFILGTIYFGIATPTEAAGVGCSVMLIIAITFYGLRFKGIFNAMKEAALINSMMVIIMIGASFFTYMMGSSNLAESLTTFTEALAVPPIMVVIAIMIILLFIGCFLDPLTNIMLTLPVFLPVILSLGYNPLWFGVLYVVNLETGLITPPMAINFFLAKNAFQVPSGALIRGMIPFLITLLIFLVILVIFPQISTWLPGMMSK